MKRLFLLLILVTMFMVSGCSSKTGSAGIGAVGGAVVGAGSYEYNLKRQMDRIERDVKDGKIDQREYEIRKDQIERDSFIK